VPIVGLTMKSNFEEFVKYFTLSDEFGSVFWIAAFHKLFK
jgi:hypothetical protein